MGDHTNVILKYCYS